MSGHRYRYTSPEASASSSSSTSAPTTAQGPATSNSAAQEELSTTSNTPASETPLLDLAKGGGEADQTQLLASLQLAEDKIAEYQQGLDEVLKQENPSLESVSAWKQNLASYQKLKAEVLEKLGVAGRLDAGVASAEDIVTLSNQRDDPTWDLMNGGYDGLNTKPGEKKPNEWYNGFQIVDGQVKLNRKGLQTDIDTLAEYRQMVMDDFNFSGTIDLFLAKGEGAEEAFVDAMLRRYCGEGSESDPELVEVLSRNIWAYATTGADITGNTDIGQMQGMLHALDSEIVRSSDSNTPMSSDTFTLPGSDLELPLGDGLHGRATILTTRHLLANMSPDEAEAAVVDFEQEGLIEDEHDLDSEIEVEEDEDVSEDEVEIEQEVEVEEDIPDQVTKQVKQGTTSKAKKKKKKSGKQKKNKQSKGYRTRCVKNGERKIKRKIKKKKSQYKKKPGKH